MKLAVIFPGIGYHSDKPLFYYTKKVLKATGYEIKEVKYENLPHVTHGDRDSMSRAYEMAHDQVWAELEGIDFSGYEKVVFAGKSLGSVLAAEYTSAHKLNDVYHISMTPVEDTLKLLGGCKGAIFHGLADPWLDSSVTNEYMNTLGNDYKLYIYENANHSLETGDALTDLSIMQSFVKTLTELI
jgi:phosphoglycolate phosphatase